MPCCAAAPDVTVMLSPARERQVRRELIENLVPADADELESRQRKRLRARVGDARGFRLQIDGE